MEFRKVWVNAPSKLHSYHEYHGLKGIAVWQSFIDYKSGSNPCNFIALTNGLDLTNISTFPRRLLCEGWKDKVEQYVLDFIKLAIKEKRIVGVNLIKMSGEVEIIAFTQDHISQTFNIPVFTAMELFLECAPNISSIIKAHCIFLENAGDNGDELVAIFSTEEKASDYLKTKKKNDRYMSYRSDKYVINEP